MNTIEGLVAITALICITNAVNSYIERKKPNTWTDGSGTKFMPKR